MQEYPVKRGYTKDLRVTMESKLVECFGVEPKKVGEHLQITYGALKVLDVSTGKDQKTLVVDTQSDSSVKDEVILDTNRRFRRYLEEVTGYSTKERVKKAKSVEPE